MQFILYQGKGYTSNLVLKFGIREYHKTTEQFQSIDKLCAISVPNTKRGLVYSEYQLKVREIKGKIVAYGFEIAVVLTKFGQGN